MTDIPDALPNGRPIEKVPVKIPTELAQVFSRIAAAELRLKNVTSSHEGTLFAQQFSVIVLRGANVIKKYAEEHREHQLDLKNVAEEFDVLAAVAINLAVTIKTHPRDIAEHKQARNEGFAEVMKQSQNAGAAVREYLLAVADAEKTAELYEKKNSCRSCGALLIQENFRIADGCPCNSPRGINHDLVPVLTCTCTICDPAQTGSTRYGE